MNSIWYESITEWQDSVFTKATATSAVNHLIEEVSELKGSIQSPDENTRLEIADCFLLLVCICNKLGMSWDEVEYALEDKMTINRSRKWGEVNEQGYVKHQP